MEESHLRYSDDLRGLCNMPWRKKPRCFSSPRGHSSSARNTINDPLHCVQMAAGLPRNRRPCITRVWPVRRHVSMNSLRRDYHMRTDSFATRNTSTCVWVHPFCQKEKPLIWATLTRAGSDVKFPLKVVSLAAAAASELPGGSQWAGTE
jgi:hypothetical protein